MIGDPGGGEGTAKPVDANDSGRQEPNSTCSSTNEVFVVYNWAAVVVQTEKMPNHSFAPASDLHLDCRCERFSIFLGVYERSSLPPPPCV